ncbi:MAG: hypothetical protein ACTSR8_03860 [Promethearchaeota archaeon]
MPKDPHETAERLVNRARQHYEAENYKKAGRNYTAAGELFLNLQEYGQAKDCFFNAANSFINIDKISLVLDNLRNAADVSILSKEYLKAYQFFKAGLKYIPELNSLSSRDFNYILFSSLSYLSLFIKGKQDQGLNLLKEVKRKVTNAYFKGSPLVKLVKNLTIAIRDKNQAYLDKVEEEFEQYKFREAEEQLIKEVLVIAKTHNSLITNLLLDKDEYTTKDLINLSLKIDTKPLIEISKYPFYNYSITDFKITNVGVSLSDNLIAQEKPKLPISIKPGELTQIDFTIRPNFQVDKSFIGPILLTCEINNSFIFFLKTQTIDPHLISPPPQLEITLKNLRTPLLEQTFPMQILVENKSEGEALDITIEVEFPKELHLIRGTTKKQLYSLKPNEDISWEVSIKPMEAGDHEIRFTINFKDPDQNQVEDIKTFPFSIQL